MIKRQDLTNANPTCVEVSIVYSKVTRLTQQSMMLTSNVESYNVASTPTTDSSEILDRVRKSHNVIVRRVAENSDPASDFNTVTRILELVVPFSSKYTVSSSRIGSENRRGPRPILVSLSNPIIARDILGNKKLLSTSEISSKSLQQTMCLRNKPNV
ncbi:hypothetical protein HHI36_006997 [Cryptolaemus montrouzieri]|uniref:Uncharacterized protein n=1 Tax=Cryptolaemus montrouzieri TaxID=559131 RepID=A0ABD2MN82_9CUCU